MRTRGEKSLPDRRKRNQTVTCTNPTPCPRRVNDAIECVQASEIAHDNTAEPCAEKMPSKARQCGRRATETRADPINGNKDFHLFAGRNMPGGQKEPECRI